MASSPELEKKFKEEINVADWSKLKPHHKRGALFIVENRISIIQMAIDIALDDTTRVKEVMDLQLLRSPTKKEVESWDADPDKDIAAYLIIQPYVLIQLQKDASSS